MDIEAATVEARNIGNKIAEFEMDADEHKLVIAALTPLPASKKCWRRVGAVLVEGDVSQTLPILKANLSGIEKTLGGLREIYKKKLDELGRQQQQQQQSIS